ncbi:MAG: 30S ribosomal protein S15 [bacterium]
MVQYIGEEQKKDVIETFQKHKTDTGSSEVQIAVLTKRINYLVDHLKKHKKDHHTRRGLLIMVSRRRRLVNYLKRKNPASLETLAKQLKLKV